MISHDHMDHLDYFSICELIDKNKVKFWVVPLGIKSWLMDKAGVPAEDIIELEWWEGVRLSKSTSSTLPEIEGLVRPFDKSSGERSKDELHASIPEKNSLVITCAPAQHWCSRTPFDRNRRLWCSYAAHATPALSQSTGFAPLTHSFYFAGDTGLPPEFPLHHMIGDRLGPFDLAAIPIGAYEPNWFMRESHCNPTEAVKIHQAVRSKRSVAVHFDTFDLADEPREEPPTLLLEEVNRVNQDILNMAVEVVTVADEVGITAKLEAVENDLVVSDITLPTNNDQVSAEKLAKLLPPLVDFAVIKQGQSISSAETKT
jgi:N-acyl-phosphatidylethanolamine-hydrolysing phospholipase D